MSKVSENSHEIIKKFNEYGCKDFYIMSFMSDNFFGNDRLTISGCNDLLTRNIYFNFEKNRNSYKISFTLKVDGKKYIETFESTAEIFNELLIQLDGIDEMRARQISSLSPIYGAKRSAQKLIL